MKEKKNIEKNWIKLYKRYFHNYKNFKGTCESYRESVVPFIINGILYCAFMLLALILTSILGAGDAAVTNVNLFWPLDFSEFSSYIAVIPIFVLFMIGNFIWAQVDSFATISLVLRNTAFNALFNHSFINPLTFNKVMILLIELIVLLFYINTFMPTMALISRKINTLYKNKTGKELKLKNTLFILGGVVLGLNLAYFASLAESLMVYNICSVITYVLIILYFSSDFIIKEKNKGMAKRFAVKHDNDMNKFDEIEKAKKLLDAGAITQDEFDVMKQKIMKDLKGE